MEVSFAQYIQQRELIAFFSGYAFVFIVIQVLAGLFENRGLFFKKLQRLLPWSYSLIGTLYLGFILKNAYEAYQVNSIFYRPENPLLTAWAILSILMWFNYFSSKPNFSFLHSLVFFYLVVKEIYLYTRGQVYREAIITDMKLFTDSVLLSIASLLFIFFISVLLRFILKKRQSA